MVLRGNPMLLKRKPVLFHRAYCFPIAIICTNEMILLK